MMRCSKVTIILALKCVTMYLPNFIMAQIYGIPLGIQSYKNYQEGHNQNGFASIVQTWEVVLRKINCFVNNNSSNRINTEDFTDPELRTLLAFITISSLMMFILIIACCLYCESCIKPKVPSYLSSHFPLYQRSSESRTTTPTFGRRPYSMTNANVNLESSESDC